MKKGKQRGSKIASGKSESEQETATVAPPRTGFSPTVWVQSTLAKWWAVAATARFAKLYAAFGLFVLLATTILWAVLGAHIAAGNADQLVNSYLFEHVTTFRGATLPGQHTFLFKWPLFFGIKLAGFSSGAFAAATVATVLLTVFLLAWVLYRIERRPLVFGTICLALASALLLVPAQPYAGGLLPVNMAMLTTRNLEYMVYIFGLVLFVRAPRINSKQFWLAVAAMGILIASDKLFLTIGVGAALLAVCVYAFVRRWDLVTFSTNWLVGQLLAGAGAVALLWFINASGVTHIADQSTAGPYGFVHSPHGFLLGSVYAVLGLLTETGANPAFDARLLHDIPHRAIAHFATYGGLAFVVNLLLAAAGAFGMMQILRRSLARSKAAVAQTDSPSKLSLMMIWTTVVAGAVFVASNHYYAGDARYLAISLFTLFICGAVALRRTDWTARRLVKIGMVITLAVVLGMFAAVRTYHDEKMALSTVNRRDAQIATILAQHKVNVLVGDYWRVIPSRLASNDALHVMPLANCSQARGMLSSAAWQPDLRAHGFAYLLSFDQKLTDYPNCTLDHVVKDFGRPNASSLIAGSLAHPKELLLFYDHGRLHSAPKTPPPPGGPSTVVPISLDELPNASCLTAPSTLSIAAHQDDDLLFMSPDVARDIHAGNCVHTIYVTAGDAGSNSFYWLGREQGSEAAYNSMLGTSDIWIHRIVRLDSGQYITVANPRGNPRISLIFMNLPDGNLRGEGFGSSGNESLARLESGQVKAMPTVDGQSVYTSQQLVDALTELMAIYRPSKINTQSNFAGKIYPDHSDHMAVGRYTQQAYRQFEAQQFAGQVVIPIRYYIGYPVHEMPENVSAADLAEKTAAFAAYTQYDDAVCAIKHPCRFASVFNAYLARQYENTE